MFPVVVRLFVVRAGISATCGVDFSSGAPHLSGWSARGGDPISDGFSSANTHLVCFLVREHRELLERAGQRGASRARVRLVRNVHGGARHGVCSSGTDWFSVAGGASVTSRRRRCAAGVGSGGQRVAGAVDGNARRPRVRACSRCLVARARARTRTSSPRAVCESARVSDGWRSRATHLRRTRRVVASTRARLRSRGSRARASVVRVRAGAQGWRRRGVARGLV